MVSRRQYRRDRPAFTPRPYGLLSVADVVEPGDDDRHWQNGILYQPDSCGIPLSIEVACVTGAGATKAPNMDLDDLEAEAFAVYAFLPCGPVGQGNNLEELRDRTVRFLRGGEAYAVENAFWTGDLVGTDVLNPHLAANAPVSGDDGKTLLQRPATVVGGGPLPAAEAIGVLEAAVAACYTGVPTIHVPLALVGYLADVMQWVQGGDKITTVAGSDVVVGAGYPGTGPAGTGTRWMYATSPVQVLRSEVKVYDPQPASSVDRSKNSVVMIAERVYVVSWDCCLFAVEVEATP